MVKYPEREKVLKFEEGDSVVEFKVKFPNNGQLLDVQSELSRLLDGRTGAILDSNTHDGAYAFHLASAMANFKILIPEAMRAMGGNFETMDAIDGAKIVNVYISQFLPWFNEWRTILQNGGKPIEVKE